MPITDLASCAQTLNIPYTGKNAYYSSVSIDTRTLREGELFIAIKGRKWDGHDFIEIACQKKAAAIIGELPISTSIPYLEVPNTRVALGLLAQHHRQKFSIPIIALTGSCGKTTTKEYLRSILSQVGPVLAPIKSFNNDIGVPVTLLELSNKHCFAVLEMGASAPFEISWLTQLAKPTIAIILNIAPAHLEGFGSIEAVAQEKALIFQGLSKEGTAILPLDFKRKWIKHIPNQRIIYFGHIPQVDVYAKEIQLKSNKKATFKLTSKEEEITITLPLPGKHQVDNALAASAAALAVGASFTQIQAGLQATKAVSGRLKTKKTKKYGTVINDTYNANPKSVRAALELLESYSKPRVFVFGDMSELGEQREYYHYLVGEWARELGVQTLLTYGNYSSGASHAFGKGSQHFESQHDLIHTLKAQLHSDCTTLIKGSRCMVMEEIVKAVTTFSI